MPIGKALASLGKGVLKRAVKGAVPPLSWADWIHDLYEAGISGKFTDFAPYGKGLKRQVWRMIAPNFIKRGYSTYKTLQIMRAVGLGIRTQDAYALMNVEKRAFSARERLATLSWDDVPTDVYGIESGHAMPSTYRYKVGFNVYDETGEITGTEYRQIYLNNHMSLDELDKFSGPMMHLMGYVQAQTTWKAVSIEQIYINPR